MGGEYLPDLREDEVEICRIISKSTTMDVSSIRAQNKDSLIHYSFCDEYQDWDEEPSFKIFQKPTDRPLSFSELINLIDNMKDQNGNTNGVLSWYKWQVKEESIFDVNENYRDFITVESSFYEDLAEYYEEQVKNFLDEHVRKALLAIIQDCISDKEALKEITKYLDEYYIENNEYPKIEDVEDHHLVKRAETEKEKINEYRDRYFKYKNPSTKEEVNWRISNQKILEKELHERREEEMIRDFISESDWNNVKPHNRYESQALNKRYISLIEYVKDYRKKNNKFPYGTHIIGKTRITFKKKEG